jgi:hypothetical protein
MAEITPTNDAVGVELAHTPTPSTPVKAPTVSRIRIRKQGIADAAGICELHLFQVSANAEYFIERISVETSSVATSMFGLYEDLPSELYRCEASLNGNNDIADEGSPIWLPSGTVCIGQWTGADVGASCWVVMQVRVEET